VRKLLVSVIDSAERGIKARKDIHPSLDLAGLFKAAYDEADLLARVEQRYLVEEAQLFRDVDDFLDNVLREGNVGSTLDQDDLDALLRAGRNRMLQQVPPGFADFEQKMAQGRTLEHALGDLIFWEETLRFAANRRSVVAVVTAEKKRDWWDFSGGSMQAHPDLLAESLARTGREIVLLHVDDFVAMVSTPARIEALVAPLIIHINSACRSINEAIRLFENAQISSYPITGLMPGFEGITGFPALRQVEVISNVLNNIPDFTNILNPGLPKLIGADLPNWGMITGVPFSATRQAQKLTNQFGGLPDFTQPHVPNFLTGYDIKFPSTIPDYTRVWNVPSSSYATHRTLNDLTGILGRDVAQSAAAKTISEAIIPYVRQIERAQATLGDPMRLVPELRRFRGLQAQLNRAMGFGVDLTWLHAQQEALERLARMIDPAVIQSMRGHVMSLPPSGSTQVGRRRRKRKRQTKAKRSTAKRKT
ncbi:MAG TPA: PIN-like domain-containing protein, partial [Candidatus Cybelea sp.]